MIEFELDIPSLTEEGIQMGDKESFSSVKQLHSSSMINELLLNKMPIPLIDSSDKRVVTLLVVVAPYSNEQLFFVHDQHNHICNSEV